MQVQGIQWIWIQLQVQLNNQHFSNNARLYTKMVVEYHHLLHTNISCLQVRPNLGLKITYFVRICTMIARSRPASVSLSGPRSADPYSRILTYRNMQLLGDNCMLIDLGLPKLLQYSFHTWSLPVLMLRRLLCKLHRMKESKKLWGTV